MRRFASLFTLALLPAAAGAQTYDSAAFAGMEWRNVGPNRGGRSLAVGGSASRPNEYYFGAVGGGLWKSTDAGLTWRPVTDGQIRSSSVGAVAVAESNPDVVYIGMGETELRGNIMQGDGVYKTTDGGRTWRHAGLASTQAIARVRVDPGNPDIVYVAALGHPAAPNPERGVFKSTDGGSTWRKVLFRNDSTGAIDLVVDRTNPRVLYASLWQAYRVAWRMESGGAGSGLFKSTDGGEHWTELTRNPGLPRGVLGKIGIAVSPADPTRLYAVVESDSGGVYRSDDAGRTWRRTNDERKIRQRAFYYSRIYADPKNRDRVYALNVGFYRSDDGGVTFDTTLRVPHGDNHDLWIAPNDPQRMIEANDGGGTVTINGGRTWTDERYPTAQLYHVTTTNDVPYHVCGAQQDNSTVCLPSSGSFPLATTGASLGDWYYDVGGGESGYIAPNPANPDIIYAGSQGALLTRFNRRTGQIRDVQVYPRFFSGEPASALPERWQWTFPIVFSPQNPRVIYTTSQHLWRTTNEGQSWTRVSPDLTRHDPATLGLSGGPITHDMNGPEIYATIFTVAPSHFDSLTLWTGSDDGLAYLTRDGGRSWSNVTPPDLPAFSRISLIDASPTRPGTSFLAAKRYQLDDRAPYIYRTTDYGRTWTKIVTGIRDDDYVHAVREDPVRRGLLFAGTEHGVYVSFDDGGHWQSLRLGLPDTQVSDLVVKGHDLVIGTHGRSLYVLDNIDPLRQIAPPVVTAPAHLYRPHDAIRGVYAPVFQYHLGRAADTVRIEILDASGTIIRTFTGTPRDSARSADERRGRAPTDSAASAGKVVRPTDSLATRGATTDPALTRGRPACDERRRVSPRPGTRRGLNRFTWDATYAGATTFECLILWSASAEVGPKAPPGTYRVRLVANGVTQTFPFALTRDPNLVGVTDADLRAQFELAVKIRDKVSAANEAVIRIRRVRDAIADRLARARDTEVDRGGRTLVQGLTAVEEALYQVRNRSGQDPLNFPIKLNNRLAALERSVETGDARPTDASYAVFRELSGELDREIARLNTILSADLRAWNRLLENHGLTPVPVAGQ